MESAIVVCVSCQTSCTFSIKAFEETMASKLAKHDWWGVKNISQIQPSLPYKLCTHFFTYPSFAIYCNRPRKYMMNSGIMNLYSCRLSVRSHKPKVNSALSYIMFTNIGLGTRPETTDCFHDNTQLMLQLMYVD